MKSLDPSDQDNRREQLQDRLTEQQLREAFNAETPPDLASQILAAADRPAESDPTAPTPTRVAAAPASAKSAWRDLAVVACLLVLIGGGVFALIALNRAADDGGEVATVSSTSSEPSWKQQFESIELPESFEGGAALTDQLEADHSPEVNQDVAEIVTNNDFEIVAPLHIPSSDEDLQLSAAQIEFNEMVIQSVVSGALTDPGGSANSGLGGRSAAGRAGAVRRGGGSSGVQASRPEWRVASSPSLTAERNEVVAEQSFDAEQDRAALVRQAAQARQQLAVLVEIHKTALQSVETAQKRIGVQDGSNRALREDVVVALHEIDKRYNEYLEAFDQAHQAGGEVMRLEARQQQLIDELAKAKTVLDANDLKVDTPADDVVPKIDGSILRVAQASDQVFIELSVGSDDGIRQGHEIEVYRGGTWLGRAAIVRTTADRAVGKINRQTQRGEIRPRDRVETRGGLIDSKKNDEVPNPGQTVPAAEPEKKPPTIKQLTNGWRRSGKLPNASRLMVGENEELPLQGLQVNVHVDGYRARVLLDMYFLNPHPQRLEGSFQLRLPNEASLYFFAFGETTYGPQGDERQGVRQAFFNLRGENQLGTQPDEIMLARSETWKAPKEARMVTRVKAAHAYRETVRRRVDPALVEWAGAGIFSARVFPLMPQKLHRVVIGYDVNLLRLGDDLVYRLDLPDQVGECTVDLNVAAQAGKQAVIKPEVRPFTAAGRAYFHYDRPEYRQFEVRMQDAGNTLIHGEDPDSGPFFAASFLPQLPAGKAAGGAEQAVFMVDTSLSSNPEKFNVWLSLMKATLTNNRDTIREFAVLFFNIEQHWWQQKFVVNSAENVGLLTTYCYTLALEGATDLGGALRVAAAPAWQGELEGKPLACDYFLLSDGAITWGERDLHHLLQVAGLSGAVFAYRTGLAETDIETLTHLARETGGAVFTVVGDAEVEAASKAHRQPPWQLLEVGVPGGSDLMLAGQPRTLFAGQQLLLVGRGTPADDAVISLKVKRGNKRRTIDVAIEQSVYSDLAPRQYGHVATLGLEELGGATEDVSAAYARHFRITGQTCSLLMLESEADYQRFNIKPQDDAFVVKSTEAATVIASVFDRMAARLGNAKAAFTTWMEKLEKTPGLSFQMSPALKVAVDGLPESAFAVRVEPLACNQRTWEPIAGPLREMLSVRSFSYADIMREAERRRISAGAADALKALSSLVEHSPGDLVLARDVGFSALDWGLGGQAYHLLRRVAESRPYEPQTYLAIAHCLADMDRADLALLYYEIALGANWDDRFPDFKQIASVDYLHFLRQVAAGKLRAAGGTFAAARLESLSREVDLTTCDLLITMMWNTDGTDVDMHVVEPSGEECYYEHRTTRAGGRLSRDVTQGYGPELYFVRNAPPGEYKIRAKYFSSDQNRLSTRTRVFATVYENWGTPDERLERRTVTLDTGQQTTDIMTVKR